MEVSTYKNQGRFRMTHLQKRTELNLTCIVILMTVVLGLRRHRLGRSCQGPRCGFSEEWTSESLLRRKRILHIQCDCQSQSALTFVVCNTCQGFSKIHKQLHLWHLQGFSMWQNNIEKLLGCPNDIDDMDFRTLDSWGLLNAHFLRCKTCKNVKPTDSFSRLLFARTSSSSLEGSPFDMWATHYTGCLIGILIIVYYNPHITG